MNVLIESLNKELEKIGLLCAVKKETNTLLKCYLYDVNDYVLCFGGLVQDYGNCKKFDVVYKKADLYTIVNGAGLKDFCLQELKGYKMADSLNMLRR